MVKKIVISTLVGTAVLKIFDMLVHQTLLAGLYESTASLWRPIEEMTAYFPHDIVVTIVFVFVFGLLMCPSVAEKNMRTGLRFGFRVGLLLGLMMSNLYFYMPIPLELGLAWFLAPVVKMSLLGAVTGHLYRGTST